MKNSAALKVLATSSTLLIVTALSACGVRGKPQPPLTPAELGRGKPTFRRGTEEFAFPAVPTPSSVPDRKSTSQGHEDNG